MAVKEHEGVLLERCNRIHLVKLQSMEEQQQKIRTSMLALTEIVNTLDITTSTDKLAIDYNKNFSLILNRISRELGSMEPYKVKISHRINIT